MTKLLNIMVGISGSGKSTFISKHFSSETVVSPDNIRKELTGDVSDQSRNQDVWKLATDRAKSLIDTNGVVVLDALNLNAGEIKRFLKSTEATKVNYFIFLPAFEISANRIKSDIDAKKDRSNVSVEVLKKQWNKFINNIKNILALEGSKIFLDSKTGEEISEKDFSYAVNNMKHFEDEKENLNEFKEDTNIKTFQDVNSNNINEFLWAYGNAGFSDEQERNDWLLDRINSIYPWGYKNIPAEVKLYRVIKLKSPEDINKANLGSHWVNDKDLLGDSEFLSSIGINDKTDLYIVEILAKRTDINDLTTMVQNVLNPLEEEIFLKNNGKGVKIVNLEKLDGIKETFINKAKSIINSTDFKEKMGIVNERVENDLKEDELKFDVGVELNQDLMKKFVNYCKKFLQINVPIKVVLSSHRKAFKTMAYYVTGKGFAHVYAKDRFICDVMRSLAHELQHLKQDLNDKINPKNSGEENTGVDIENEANAIAGVIMRNFGKMYPQIYENPKG